MNLFLIAIIIVLVAAVLVLIVFARREAARHGTGVVEEAVGICSVALERASQKEIRKEKALALLREKGELQNVDIRGQLNVSSRAVVKYMSELEKEGKVEQVGDTGRAVVYRLKNA